MAKSGESNTDDDGSLAIMKNATCFTLSCRSQDATEDFAIDLDGTVGRQRKRRILIAEVEVASITAFSVWCNKEGGIGIAVEDHVAGMIADFSVGMGAGIVKKHLASCQSFFCRASLLLTNFVESSEHCGINGTSVIEKAAHCRLDIGNTSSV